MSWYWFIFEITINVFQIYMILNVMVQLFPPKNWYVDQTFAFTVTWLIGSIILSIYSFVTIPFLPDVFFCAILLFIYSLLLRKGQWANKLFWSLTCCAITGAVIALCTLLYTLIPGITLHLLYGSNGPRMAFVITTNLFLFLIFKYLPRLQKQEHAYTQLSKRTIVAMGILPFISLCILLLILQYSRFVTDEQINPIFPALISFGLLAANIAILALFDYISKQSYDLILMKQIAQQAEMETRHREEMISIDQRIKEFQHSFHNFTQTMEIMVKEGNLEKLKVYLKNCTGMYNEIDTMQKITGISEMDSIFSSKKIIADKHGIHLDINAIVPPDLPLHMPEFSVLFGNLLDNALDACVRLADHADKVIVLYIQPVGGHLQIHIHNPTNGRIKQIGDQFLTIKSEAGVHGFGLSAIDHIVSKYGGYCERKHENNIFSTDVLLPLKNLKGK